MPTWLESAAGSLVGSGLLLTAVKMLWAKVEAKDKEIAALRAEKDAEIAALNVKLEQLAERRISDLREMAKPQSSSPR
jgi:hypothetical protein